MKKKFFVLLTLIVSCIFCTTLMSCGGDDDSNEFNGNNNGSGDSGEKRAPEGLKAIDLGIVVNGKNIKWANMNVGATSESEYGDFFAWGETTGYSSAIPVTDGHAFKWETYKWCNGTDNTLTKYCTDSNYGTVDNKTTLETTDDAATANWGRPWRMPTHEEWNALLATKENTTDYTWTRELREGHHWGFTIKQNSTGNSIFLPQAGNRRGNKSNVDNQYSNGHYWSSSIYDPPAPLYTNCRQAWSFRIYVDSGPMWSVYERCDGLSIRAVQSE